MINLENLTIQTFDDQKQRGRKDLAQIFLYDPEKIKRLQNEGAGIFFSINPQLDPNERLIKNTSEMRAIGLDLDVAKEGQGLSREEVEIKKQDLFDKIKSQELLPNFLIDTKNGGQPVWELSDPIKLSSFEERDEANKLYQALVKGAASKLGTKSEGDNLARVLRLPGSNHLKNPSEPFEITVVELSDKKVSLEEFKKAYPPIFTTEPIITSEAPEYMDPMIRAIVDFPIQQALERLSGKELVEYEQFNFVPNSSGTTQIIIDGKSSGQWIDPVQNTIGGPGVGHGNPTIIQFVQWYGIKHRNEEPRVAKVKAIRALKEILKIDVNVIVSSDLEEALLMGQIEDLTADDGGMDVDWKWKGFVGGGLKTLINAFWKAGKTTLLLELIKTMANSGQFAGTDTKPTKICVISEENKIIWIRRREKYGFKGFGIKCKPFKRKLNRIEWEEYLKGLTQQCKTKGYELVVFDTISDFWPVLDENDAIQMKDALRPLNYLTEAGLAVLIFHHFNRGGDREGGAGRGSGALPADADVIVDFCRFSPEDGVDTRRVLKSISRFEETPREVTIQLTDSGYLTLGTKAEVLKQDKLDTLLELIPVLPEATTVKSIMENWSEDKAPHKGTFSRWLNELEKTHKVSRGGKDSEGFELWSQVAPIIDGGATQL